MNFIDEYNQKKVTAVFEREDAVEHFTWNSWHFSGIERQLAAGGLAFYVPITYSELPRYYRDVDYPSNVVNVSSYTDRLQWLF